jgi:hypothetical protein
LPEQACKICKICKDNSKEKKNWCNRMESSLSPKSWICSTHINWVECSSRSNMSDISSELTSNYWWLPKQKTIQSQGYRRFVVESATAQRPIMSLICKCYPDISRPPRQIGGMLFWSQCSRTQSSGNLAKLDKYNLLPSLKFVRLPSDCASHNGIWETLSFQRNLCPQECTIRHLSKHTGALVLLLSPRTGWEPGQRLFAFSFEQQAISGPWGEHEAVSLRKERQAAGCFNLLQ